MDSFPTEKRPLRAFVEKLRRRCEAAGRFSGGHLFFVEELELFREFCREERCFLEPDSAPSRRPDDYGNEHEVWYLKPVERYLKITWANFFGLNVIYRGEEDRKTTPIGYLERWLLHNDLFGDDVWFHGVIADGNDLRMFISQPAISGDPASAEETAQFFGDNQWRKLSIGGEIAFLEPELRVAISDTHPGNIVKMANGRLAPIDLRVQQLDEALYEAARLSQC